MHYSLTRLLHFGELTLLINQVEKIDIYISKDISKNKTVQKFGISKISNFFLFKDVAYAHQACINLIKNTRKSVIWSTTI